MLPEIDTINPGGSWPTGRKIADTEPIPVEQWAHLVGGSDVVLEPYHGSGNFSGACFG